MTVRVELDWNGNVGFVAKAGSFTGIQVDEPREFHGDDRGPSAAEYLAIGTGGCLGTSLAYCFQRVDVVPSAISVQVDVDMQHPGEGLPLAISSMRVTITVALEEGCDADVVDMCMASFRKYCSVSNAVIAGIPVDVHVRRDGP